MRQRGRVGRDAGDRAIGHEGIIISPTAASGGVAAYLSSVAEFYALAVVVGLVQGGIQSLSRSLYARLIPPGKTAEFFGFYNMLGKFSAVIGPIAVGWVALATGSSRVSILALLVLFALGALLLRFVDVRRGVELRGAL